MNRQESIRLQSIMAIASLVSRLSVSYNLGLHNFESIVNELELWNVESTLDSGYCESHGCVWDGIADNVKCHLPFDGSKSYGYEVINLYFNHFNCDSRNNWLKNCSWPTIRFRGPLGWRPICKGGLIHLLYMDQIGRKSHLRPFTTTIKWCDLL